MIYMKLQTANLPSTVTSTRYHVAKELADDLIKQYGGEEISVLQFVSKVDTQQNDMSVMFRVSCLAAQCDMVPLSVKWSCAM